MTARRMSGTDTPSDTSPSANEPSGAESDAVWRALNDRRRSEMPPWTMPKSAWSGFLRALALRSAQRSVRSIAVRALSASSGGMH